MSDFLRGAEYSADREAGVQEDFHHEDRSAASLAADRATRTVPRRRRRRWGNVMMKRRREIASALPAISCRRHAERVVYRLPLRVIVRRAHPASRFTAQDQQ